MALSLSCRQVVDAFPDGACYLVGSALQREDYRDIDVRLVLEDEDFYARFKKDKIDDPMWQLFCVALSGWMSGVAKHTVDFQIQPKGWVRNHEVRSDRIRIGRSGSV